MALSTVSFAAGTVLDTFDSKEKKMGKIIVAGSIAYDNIMEFPGYFSELIIAERIDKLNISFLVRSLKKVRGGTAPNIAYNLALTGQKAEILGTAGSDFAAYRQWLEENGVGTGLVRVREDDFTASCFINTDLSGNQITGFYPGAMAYDEQISMYDIPMDDVSMVIIAPTEPAAMNKWCDELQRIGIPYLYDSGMQIPRLEPEDLVKGILGARIAIFNEYEYEMMHKKSGLSLEDILASVEIVVVTLGEKGSELWTNNEKVRVPAARATRVIDPTGAGDAYRAGLLKGYFEGADLERMGRYASITSVYAVEHLGATEHRYTMDEFYKRYKENFG
ncbi:MAG TPA: carbohydrate kinase family protein [Clostridiales bacterium]|jgi:adenosine kinase|nr:carbohydrate kinase family protein [Clostridiales bacterium]HQD30989.1 carbohydrate kinase family protein [Clostridiales bacterium]